MAVLAVQNLSSGGHATFTAAAGGGDTVSSSSGGSAGGWTLGTLLLVDNQSASPMDVTVDGRDPVTVATTGITVIPIPYLGFGNARSISYSDATSVFVAAVDVA